ncbi:hypothetical protein [Buttiauxella sp. A111]|uniref:hypothetical protein n=1 Tax=Buttiauxella sp. A111 TaxID=2563088 RepID=UPI0010DF4C5A|nr:hypothetical protein [Buttiauxella sp. A111]GDX07044.1 hypothetical protein BSPA111_32580 [Buttiauxella sp. A111]
MKSKVFVILTSDGRRVDELRKLASTIVFFDNAKVIFVNQSNEHELVEHIFNENKLSYDSIYVGEVIPLSIARNIALNHIRKECNPQPTDKILFSDDDCHYSKEFASYVNQLCIEQVTICPVVSDILFERFTPKGVKKIVKSTEIRLQDIMFYACSISIILPYKYANGLEFNEKLGLGNIINQGEETDYLERIILKFNPRVFYKHDCFVFHPRKNDYNPHVFFSLSYFLSNKLINSNLKGMYFKYSILFYFKYLFAFGVLIFNSRKRAIFFSCLKGIFLGVKDIYSVYLK